MSIFRKRFGANDFRKRPGFDRAKADHEETAEEAARYRSTTTKIRSLPAPVGVVLMGVGVAGLILPGPIGTPFLLAGGLVLAPRVFGKVDRCVHRRFPTFHRVSMEAVERFADDLEKRYPSEAS